MATRTLISLQEYEALPETENGFEYELSNGELIVLASPTLFHNRIRDDILVRFHVFLRQHPHLGEVTSGTDLRLAANTVRRPDVAFIRAAKLASVDPTRGSISHPTSPSKSPHPATICRAESRTTWPRAHGFGHSILTPALRESINLASKPWYATPKLGIASKMLNC